MKGVGGGYTNFDDSSRYPDQGCQAERPRVKSSPLPLAVAAGRGQWPRLLLACPPEPVRALARRLSRTHQVQDIQMPQSGLALLQLRDSALGEAYYPGEVPLALARVRVRSAQGVESDGAAQLLDDRASLARAVAIIDAVLVARLPGHEDARALLEQGRQRIEEQKAQRGALLATTRVDFSLLGTTEQDDDE